MWIDILLRHNPHEQKHTVMKTLLPFAIALLLIFTTSVNALSTHPPHVIRYIENYAEIAIREMHRSGIPASVILAQGIQESSWGQGTLSKNSNNHFGIKCKNTWTGPTYYIEDDDYQNGALIKSCFRVYSSVEESYIDHTNFLVDGGRYQPLFSYSKTDYENWSKGLKKCGYATDPNYAIKLIGNIEKYGLYKYDFIEAPEPQVVSAPVFRIPTPQAAQVIEVQPELVVSSVVSITDQFVHPNEEPVPVAVNIEDYLRNNSNNVNTYTANKEEVLVEEIEESNQPERIPTIVLTPPSYQMTSEQTPAQRETEKPTLTSVLATDDSNLLIMRGKTRVNKTLRK